MAESSFPKLPYLKGEGNLAHWREMLLDQLDVMDLKEYLIPGIPKPSPEKTDDVKKWIKDRKKIMLIIRGTIEQVRQKIINHGWDSASTDPKLFFEAINRAIPKVSEEGLADLIVEICQVCISGREKFDSMEAYQTRVQYLKQRFEQLKMPLPEKIVTWIVLKGIKNYDPLYTILSREMQKDQLTWDKLMLELAVIGNAEANGVAMYNGRQNNTPTNSLIDNSIDAEFFDCDDQAGIIDSIQEDLLVEEDLPIPTAVIPKAKRLPKPPPEPRILPKRTARQPAEESRKIQQQTTTEKADRREKKKNLKAVDLKLAKRVIPTDKITVENIQDTITVKEKQDQQAKAEHQTYLASFLARDKDEPQDPYTTGFCLSAIKVKQIINQSSITVPKNYKQAVNNPEYQTRWYPAMVKQIDSFASIGIYTLVEWKPGMTVLPNKWVFDEKNKHGSFVDLLGLHNESILN